MPYGTVNADVISDSNGGSVAPISSVMRNRIINGAMVIDQRNAGASVTPTTDTYTLDRWVFATNVASKASIQQTTTAPTGFTNSLKITSLSAYSSLGATDVFVLRQKIEGYNVADLGFGSANAKTVTLSFWVQSSLTGIFAGSVNNSAENRSYPFTYSIPVANIWTQISVPVVGDTTGTWLTTNGNGLEVGFSMGMGSTFSGTAGVWSGSPLFSATGATSVVGTNGATFYITGVQLEKGTQATGFEYRQYGQELALCQRYYQTSYPYGTAIQSATGVTDGVSFISINTSDSTNGGTLPATMRATPTFAVYSTLGGVGSPSARDNNAGTSTTGITLNGGTTTNLPRLSKSAGLPATGSSCSAQYTASAEL